MVFSPENLTPEEVKLAYNALMDRNSTYSKLQSEGLILYVKWLAIFLGIAFLLLIVFGRNSALPIINWLLVVFLGIAFLGFFFIIMSQDFRYDREVIHSVKLGKDLEEMYPFLIPSRYFHVLCDNSSYDVLLLGRFIPVGLLALLTATAGVYISAGLSFFLAIGGGILSATAIIMMVVFL